MNRVITKNKKKHWFFQKIIEYNAKKTKRLTEIQVLKKRLTKRVFNKKTKVIQLFKPINHWQIAANTQSN